MEFNFVDPEEEDEEQEDGIDWSLLDEEVDESEGVHDEVPRATSGRDGLDGVRGRAKKGGSIKGVGDFDFAEDIPEALTITDPEVKAKAAKGRQRRRRKVENQSYDNKRAAGWSLFCAHQEHLPNLCERYQLTEGYTCTCDCHERRGFVRPDELSESDDEAFVFNFN